MELKTVFNKRKSIRSFTGERISEAAMNNILYAANEAPVGMGKYDSVHLTVVSDKALLQKIEENTAAAFQVEKRDFLYNAPELVIVSSSAADNVGVSNAAIIAHNMALAAVDEGVGVCHIWGCVMALAQNSALVGDLNLPEGFTPICGVALGVSAESYEDREIPADRIGCNRI